MASDRLAVGDHTFEAFGLKLIYKIRGDGPLIVVQPPGWGPGSGYLQHALQRFESSHKLLYLEPRGSNGSERPANDLEMSCSHMAADLEVLRVHLALDEVSLLGHSHGGCIALAFAQRHPTRVSRLILISLQLEGQSQSEGQQAVLAARARDAGFNAAIQRLQQVQRAPPETDAEFGALLRALMPIYFFDHERDVPRFAADIPKTPSIWAYRTSLAAEQRFPMDQVRSLRAVKARTFLMHGREDFICTVRNAQVAHEGINASQVVIYDKCAHFPWVEKEEPFYKDLERFLKS